MIPRALEKKIVSMVKVFPVISLTGPRQSGKTTLVRALFPDYHYMNLENLNDFSTLSEDPLRLLRAYASKGVVIDEAQKMPDMFSYIQVIVDESREMGKFILTGSQNFLLLEKITQSLAGRAAILHLMPFGLSELAHSDRLPDSLDRIMHTGFYPAIYDREMEAPDYYPSYLQTYIERDVRSMKNIGDLSLFQRFVRLCAGRTGQLLNLSSLGNEIGINYKTVDSWLSILETSFIIFLHRPHHKNFNKRLVKQPKLFFFDTGILCSLLDIETPQQLSTHYLRGNIFESFIISEYVKMRYHEGLRSNVFFWRNNTGNEIDMLIENGEQLKAVEIKSGETIHEDFFKGLSYFQAMSGIDPKNSYLVYGGLSDYERKKGTVLSWMNIKAL